MRIIRQEDTEKLVLPGRIIQKCVGVGAISKSQKMTIGFATYCEEAGPMQPHHHAEESIYVIEAKDAWVEFGGQKDGLVGKRTLEAGMILHFEELEWHVFEYKEGGFLKVLYFYGQTQNIRPEEINRLTLI